MIISKTQQPIHIEQITELERKYNLQFPKDYVEHLLKYNGGVSDLTLFSFEENGTITQSVLSEFFPVSDGRNNLEKNIQILKVLEKRMPSHIVPFADDELGNLICISCAGADIGYIYFWDMSGK